MSSNFSHLIADLKICSAVYSWALISETVSKRRLKLGDNYTRCTVDHAWRQELKAADESVDLAEEDLVSRLQQSVYW